MEDETVTPIRHTGASRTGSFGRYPELVNNFWAPFFNGATKRVLAIVCALFSLSASADDPKFSLPGLHFQLPASQPSSQPASQPASSQAATPPTDASSLPSSQPSSQPAASQPIEPFRDRPINLLVYRHKTYPDGTDSKSIGLIYWHGIDPDSGWRLLAPFFFHYWDTTLKRDLWILPAGLTYKNKENRTTIIGPVYQRKDTGGKDTVVFPIYWKTTDSTQSYESLTIGPYYKRKSGTLTKSGVVPFAFAKKDEANDYRSLGVFPFFYTERDKGSRFVGTLLGFYSQKDQYTASGLIGPLYLSKEEVPGQPKESIQALFPLWYRKKTGEGSTEQSWFVSLPGFYQHRWREFTSDQTLGYGADIFFPGGFYRRSDASQSKSLYLINTFYKKTPSEAQFAFIPLLYRRASDTDATTLTPLFYRYTWDRPGDDSGSLTISPIWRYKTPEKSVTGVANLYFKQSAGAWSINAFPLLFAGKKYDSRYAYLLPVFFHKKTPTIEKQTTILGPLYYRRSYDNVSAGVFPLVTMRFEESKKRVTVFPVAQYLKEPGRERFVVGPFYRTRSYAINSPEATPSSESTSQPVYIDHSDETNIGLFPLVKYQHKIDDEGNKSVRWSLFPVFAKGYSEATERKWLYAFPVLLSKKGDDRLLSVLPLAWFWREGEGPTAEKFQVVIPLYVKRDTEDVSAFVSLPFGSIRNGERRTNWVGPAFWHDSPQKSVRGFLPLYFDTKTPEYQRTIFFPFSFQYEDARTTYEYVLGLYQHKSRRDEAGKTTYDQKLLLPLFWREQDGDSLRQVLGPSLYRRDTTGFDLLLPPVYLRDTTTARDAVVAPLFYYHKRNEASGAMRSEKVALLPFFGYGHGQDWKRLFTPVGFYSQDKEQERALFLNTFFWDHEESNGHGLFPLYLWRNDHETSSKTVISLLFARYRRPLTTDPKMTGKFLVAGGLFWHGENLDRRLDDSPNFTYTYLFPFYYSYKDLANQHSFKALAPLAFRRETKEETLTSVLGLFSRRNSLEQDGTVSRSRTMALPVFWRENYPKEGITNLYLGPVISHKEPGNHWSYVAPLLFWQRKDSSFNFVLAPLASYFKSESSKMLITPLGVYNQTREETRFFFVNTFYRKNDNVSSLGVMPFYFQRSNAQEGSTSRVLFPLFARYEKPVLGVGGPGKPLQSTAPGHVTSILGLYWRGENLSVNLEDSWGTRFTSIVPFYFWKEDKEAQKKSLTVGPFFWRKSPERSEAGLFPLVFVGEKSSKYTEYDQAGNPTETLFQQKHQYVLPLYFHRKSSNGDASTYAGLLFWHKRSGPDTRAWLFPIVKYYDVATSSGQETGLAVLPLFRWESSPGRYQFDSIPLSLYKGEETSGGRFLTGIWERGAEEKKTAFIPLFWFSETPQSKISYAGTFYRKETAEQNKYTLLFPLFYSQWTYNGTRQKVLFPFGYYANEPAIERTSLYLLNFYSTKSRESKSRGIWPLWQSTKSLTGDESRLSYVLPLYFYKGTKTETTMVTPLSYYYRINQYKRLWVLPYYGTRAGESNKTDYLFPFFYRSIQGKEKLTIAGPFYVGYQDPSLRVRVGLPLILDIQTKKTTAQILTPLYIHTKGKKAERWRFGLIWSYSKYDREYFLSRGASEASLTDWELRLPPIFKYTKDNEQSYQWKVLLGLVGFEKNVNKRRLFLFGIPIKLKDKPPKK